MVPPTGPLNLDVEAISGICGSISIACWVVVFSPQILENFRRGSADGLSLQFIIVWLAGDVFNILGAVLQGVLPTMIILAVYYTLADIVLLGQCFYYRGFTWKDEVVVPPKAARKFPKPSRRVAAAAAAAVDANNGNHGADNTATERTSLLAKAPPATTAGRHRHAEHEHRGSHWSALSPAVPFVPGMEGETAVVGGHGSSASSRAAAAAAPGSLPQASSSPPISSLSAFFTASRRLRAALFNILAILMVCAAGIAGWYLSEGSRHRGGGGGGDSSADDNNDSHHGLHFNPLGQVFGYFCAALYLGSRLPQLLLNWRRQSTDGVSMLFFLFACLGNLTYVLSIFAYEGCSPTASPDWCTPAEARRLYGRYLLVNLSWIAGSLGTFFLDIGIFVQFFLYRVEEPDGDDDLEQPYWYEDGDDDAPSGEFDYDTDAETEEGDRVPESEDDNGGGPNHQSRRNKAPERWDDRPILQRELSGRS